MKLGHQLNYQKERAACIRHCWPTRPPHLHVPSADLCFKIQALPHSLPNALHLLHNLAQLVQILESYEH